MTLDSLKVMNWNARSVSKRKVELIEFLTSNRIDVAVITETHLKPDLRFSIAGFRVVRQDRIHARGGGVAILVRKDIQFTKISPDTAVIESVGVQLVVSNAELTIYAAYCPRQCKGQTAQQFKPDLLKLTQSTGKFIVCGDLNTRHRMWCDDVNNNNAKLTLEVLRQNDSEKYTVNYPELPTYVGSNRKASYLDICLANFAVGKPTVIQKLSSDHYPVIYDIGSSPCEETCFQKENIIKQESGSKYASHLKSALASIGDPDLALEILCQAVEAVVSSRVQQIAVEGKLVAYCLIFELFL